MNYESFTFGERMVLARKFPHNSTNGRAMSQSMLAERCGLTQAQISRLEKSKSSNSTKIIEIAGALGVSVHWLKTGKGTPDAKDLTMEGVLARQTDNQKAMEPYLRLKKTVDSLGLSNENVEKMIDHAIIYATKLI